jgi:hypothetical protein
MIADSLRTAGLPDGVFNIVLGDGSAACWRLTKP